MPSTTIHIKDELLSRIDEIARERGTSRNRFIVDACKKALEEHQGKWPEGFFGDQLEQSDMALLGEAALEMQDSIMRLRKNRGEVNP